METQLEICARNSQVWKVWTNQILIEDIIDNERSMWGRIICRFQERGWINSLNKFLDASKQQRCCKKFPIWSSGRVTLKVD